MDLRSATDCHDYASEMAYVARKALKLPFATPDVLIDAAATVLRRMYVTINDREAAFQYVLPRGIGATAFLAGVLPVWLALTEQRIPPVAVVLRSGLECTFHRREIANTVLPALAGAIYPYHTGLRLQDMIGAAEHRLHVCALNEFAATQWSAQRHPSVVIFDTPQGFLSPSLDGLGSVDRAVAAVNAAAHVAHARLAHVALVFGTDEDSIVGRGHLQPPLWISRYNNTTDLILRRWWGAGVPQTVEEVTA